MELFCVICRLADGARQRAAETIYDGMALCAVHFDEISDVQDLDWAEREAVKNSGRRRADSECWLKVAAFTGERYCGEHGRAAGWPCQEAR